MYTAVLVKRYGRMSHASWLHHWTSPLFLFLALLRKDSGLGRFIGTGAICNMGQCTILIISPLWVWFTCSLGSGQWGNGEKSGWRCLSINRRWCTNITVRERICSPDIELLSVSPRPFYLPREFPQIFITVVYIHPKANSKSAAGTVSKVWSNLKLMSPDAPNFLGDFNNWSIEDIMWFLSVCKLPHEI